MDTTDAVRSALCTQYIKTLLKTKSYQLSRQPRFRDWEQPDLEQDLLAHVLKQAHHFDASRGSVNTFIDRVVETAAAMLVRDRGRIKRAAGYRAISLERTHISGNQRQMTLSQIVSENDLRRRCGGVVRDGQQDAGLSADVADAMAGLTRRQREIAKRLVEATEASVARDMGISRRQVRNAVSSIREHFRQAGLAQS